MYELKKNGKVFTSKSVGTGPSSYEKRIYRAVVSQSLRNTAIHGVDTALLWESRQHTAVVQPTVTIPTELSRLKKHAVQNEITSISRDTHTHTHTRSVSRMT